MTFSPTPTAPPNANEDIGLRFFVISMVGVAMLAALVRFVFPTADPPWAPGVGVTWHDEGAWVHNARNRVLFGAWSLDAWNPMYLNPIFTWLEYLSFAAFGVGLRQARLVSQVAGVAAVVLLGLGVARLGSRRAGLIAAFLLATSYVAVMYDRAALMESSMTAWLVLAWWAYARAATSPGWGLFAGLAALLAFFTKASAVFFIAALTLDAVLSFVLGRSRTPASTDSAQAAADAHVSASLWTLGGLVVGALLALLLFVGPHWAEFRFYNFEMSVTRKPSYSLRALMDRASWFPIVHDFFTRLWLPTIMATAASLGVAAQWRTRMPAERLLVLWIGLGVIELILHDVGNERRFVMLIPPVVALASLTLGRDRRLLPEVVATMPLSRALAAAPAVLFAFYLIVGAIARLVRLYEVRPGVRLSAALACLVMGVVFATWPRVPRWLASERWSVGAAGALSCVLAVGGLLQFAQWASNRTDKNYQASIDVGRLLPPGTLVHGKLANGLALENRIRPVFVGDHFGNYADRLERDDVRYLLTYIEPREGYEGAIIREVLAAYPHRRLIATFEVAESAGGHDRAALFEKGPLVQRESSADR